ncbi:BTAD domain-containing putative transcriptional regulator [Nocardia sp. BMG111209]|uniref:BTAD domain-containing putative transcriptional regulator n=1 Tax=Nocardia sp. BMG111209 TaxID=1160137 RepID=UPI00035EF66E|nr:BTAD domain-containing putative transcriptional regulator [Nocardia sp. BMG111209]
MEVLIGVLGPVRVTGDGRVVEVGSRRRREVLGRLVAAGGRAVPLATLVGDLWEDPPAAAVGTVRTFVSELRAALEPDRPPRAPSRLIETVGTGYALRIGRERVDAYRFEDAVRAARSDPDADRLAVALSWWGGEPFADLGDSAWVTRERDRLLELHHQATELHARAELARGAGASLVSPLEQFAAAHPWREQAWILLSHALYQADRQVDALAVLRRARAELLEQFGMTPATGFDELERDVLRHAPHLSPSRSGDRRALLIRTEAAGPYTRLRAMSTVAGAAALTGGVNLVLAQDQRAAAVAEAERTGDPGLTARVIAAYDVPTIWTRSDDPARAEALVETTRRTLHRIGPAASPVLRSRLLATIAMEHRGSRDRWAAEAAAEAERLARELRDPGALALALNARFVQSFQAPGGTAERAAIAGELITLADRHDLPAFAILGQLIGLQAAAARGERAAADRHAAASERLATGQENPVVPVLTAGYRATLIVDAAAAEKEYRCVASELIDSGMPGVAAGYLPLALLSLRLRHDRPAPTDPALDWGPYRVWVQPLLHLAQDDPAAARRAAAALPEPRADHLYDALWTVNAHTAIRLGDEALAARASDALAPLRTEIAGGTTALFDFGSVRAVLAALADRFGWDPAAG